VNALSSISSLLALPEFTSLIWPLAIKTTAVILAASAAGWMFSRTAPVYRHFIWRTAFLLIGMLPVLTWALPDWQVSFIQSTDSVVREAVAFLMASGEVDGSQGLQEVPMVQWMALITLIWAFGAAFLIARLGFGLARVSRLVKRAHLMTDPDMRDLAERLKNDVNISRQVGFMISPSASLPFTCGILKPVVVLPCTAQSWSANELRMVLLHELAHVKRQDVLWNVLAAFVTAIHWYNPLVWIARRRMLIESEKVCDDNVLSAGNNGGKYAEHLLSLARTAGTPVLSAISANMAHKSLLEGRIMSILTWNSRALRVGRTVTVAVLVTSLLVAVPLAALSLNSADNGKSVGDTTKSSGTTAEDLPSLDEFVPVTEQPQVISCSGVIYPDSAKEAKLEGTVRVQALIDTAGNVREVRIKESSGHKILDEAGKSAALGCKYKPALRDEKPAAVWIQYKMVFELEDK
jgi:TonB family protein